MKQKPNKQEEKCECHCGNVCIYCEAKDCQDPSKPIPQVADAPEEWEKRVAQIVMEHGTDVFNQGCLEEDIKELLAQQIKQAQLEIIGEIEKALEVKIAEHVGYGQLKDASDILLTLKQTIRRRK